ARFRDAPLEEVMRACLDDDLTWSVDEKTIVIRRKKKDDPAPAAVKAVPPRQFTVRGTVTDTTGLPLPGVSVVIKGTSRGISTDLDGNYILTDIPENAVLVFSMVSFQTQEVSVGGRSVINVVLASLISEIDEVVVVGYGKQEKESV